MIVLGVDAATSSGWGIVDTTGGRPKHIDSGVCSAQRWDALVEVIEVAIARGVELAAIETPYVDKNPDTAIKLGMVVGRWVQEFERRGIPWGGHKAAVWQQRLLGGFIGPTSPREQRKAAASAWVRSTFGLVASGDQADAICLASWRAKEAHLEQLKTRAAGAG